MSDAGRYELHTKDLWRILLGIGTCLTVLLLIGAPMKPTGPSDGAVCSLQLRTLHTIALSHANMEKLEPGSPLPAEVVLGYLEEEPKCPTHDLPYLHLNRVPLPNQPYVQCRDPDEGDEHNRDFQSQLE